MSTATTQSEALRLADWLEDQYDPTHNQEDAATELRRLYLVNQELLKALKVLVDNGGIGPEDMFDDARAAIAKATGETK